MTTFERLGYVINDHDVTEATGIRSARAVTGHGYNGWAYGGVEYHEGGWDAMVAGSGISRWVRSGGGAGFGSWFPITVVERAKSLGLGRSNGKKLSWTEGRPCDDHVHGDWSSHRCERVAVGTTDVWVSGRPTDLAVCSLHLRMHEKRRSDSERWARENAERAARMSRREEHARLGAETIEWAGPLLAELGIHPATVIVGTIGDRTGILLPAEAVATLIQEATGERYPGRATQPEGDQ